VSENDWRGIIGTPKGSKSRTIPLNAEALAALTTHRHLKGPLVFSKADGTRLDQDTCRRALERIRKLAGLKKIQWHGLRHTFASHLAMRGVPLKAIQELMGHATIEMTMRYAHLTPDVREAAVRQLDVALQPYGNIAATQDSGLKIVNNIKQLLVRAEGLEPTRITPLEPKSSASASSATLALPGVYMSCGRVRR